MGRPRHLPVPSASTYPEQHAASPAPKSLGWLCGDTQSKARARLENTLCAGGWAEPSHLPFGQWRALMEKHLSQTPQANSWFLFITAGFVPPHPSPRSCCLLVLLQYILIHYSSPAGLSVLSLQLASVNLVESGSIVAKKYSICE